MARGLGDGLLRFCNGAWRDNDGDAVDIVEVVRCKDCANCQHKTPLDGFFCKGFRVLVKPDDFCSYGERKTDERKAD